MTEASELKPGIVSKPTAADETHRRITSWKQAEGGVEAAEHTLLGDSFYTCERVNGSEFSITESPRVQKV